MHLGKCWRPIGIALAVLAGTCVLVHSTRCPVLAWQRSVTSKVSSSHDAAQAVAIGPNGEVFVVGCLSAPRDNSYAVAMRLAPRGGSRVWQRRITGTRKKGERCECLQAVGVDHGGNPVVAGSVTNVDTYVDFFVAKLGRADGRELWRYTATGLWSASDDEALAVAVDGAGDVIAGGRVEKADDDSDFAVVKISGSDGREIWRRVFPGPCAQDQAGALTVDITGDVIAIGMISQAVGPYVCDPVDFDVVKIAGVDGAEIWRRDLAGTDDYPLSVAVNGERDLLVAGNAEQPTPDGESIWTLVVARLSGEDGTDIWRMAVEDPLAEGPYLPRAVVIDNAGDAIVAGSYLATWIPYRRDLIAVKVRGETGEEVWRSTIADGYASAMSLDALGNVVVAGRLGQDLAAVQLDGKTGEVIWTQIVDGTATGEECANYRPRCSHCDEGEAEAVVVTGEGRVVVAGYLCNAHGRGSDEDFATIGFSDRLAGSRLRLKDSRADGSVGVLSLLSLDPGILAPARGSSGDPAIYGADLQLSNPRTGETTSVSLPATGWSHKRSLLGAQAYLYKGRRGDSPRCTLKIESGKLLKARCRGRGLFALDEPSQGSLAVRLTLGNEGFPYCMLFGGRIHRDRGGATGGVFSAVDADAPLACRAGPTTTRTAP